MIERGIDGALIGVEGIAKADAEDVGPGDDADELVALDDGDVMDAVLADEGADFGDGIAVVGGDHITGHEVGDGVVAFHGWLVMKHGGGGRGLLCVSWEWVGGCCAVGGWRYAMRLMDLCTSVIGARKWR